MMENLWENYMQNGKINPVSGIFLGKNNFGYQDKTEYVVTPNTNSDSDYSTDDIRKRYLTDSPTLEQLPDSSNSDEYPTFDFQLSTFDFYRVSEEIHTKNKLFILKKFEDRQLFSSAPVMVLYLS
jgi:hypothetical protein